MTSMNGSPKSREWANKKVEFRLPQTTYDSIKKIIIGYSKKQGSTTFRELANDVKLAKKKITISHGFLLDLGIIEVSFQQKNITVLGKQLGRALQFDMRDDIVKYWREVIDNNEICSKILNDIKSSKNTTGALFQKQIFYFAKYTKTNADHRVGANTLIDIFKEARYVTKQGKYYSVSSSHRALQRNEQNYQKLPENHKHLAEYLPSFMADNPHREKNVFLMMRFRKGKQHEQINTVLREIFASHGFNLLRADDKDYTGDLWDNVCLYMVGCHYGVSVFEEIEERVFNTNVAIELGFMFALGKRCLILKDKSMPKMPTDIIGKLYKEFDTYSIEETIKPAVEAWFKDLGK